MTGRSFMEIDFSNEEDMLRLLYCATVIHLTEPYTFEQFALTLENKRVLSASIRAVEAYNAFAHQFARKPSESEAERDDADTTPISRVAAKLIVTGGLDARYVLDEMLVEDLPMYLDALSERIKQEEESRRLWTFHAIRPHVNGNKINSPTKIHTFPWELEDQVCKAKEDMEKNEETLRRFLGGELIDIDKINWTKRES